MPFREDLISSAVTFLQDPSVANAPLDKRIAFLQSKNLTQEEVDAALSRAGDAGFSQSSPQGYGFPQQQQQQQQIVRQPQQGYGYGQYNGGYWGQAPPPEIPRRDWRDWFIMATVMSGLSYGRYILPIITPPTPPQLTADKTAIDDSFSRAFALIDQLTADTSSIKASEEERRHRLDAAISEFEASIKELKEASQRRDQDTRRINGEVLTLQSMLPSAMKAQEEASDARLKELNSELRSLKTLVANRMGTGVPTSRSEAGVNGTGVGGEQGRGAEQARGSGASTPVGDGTAEREKEKEKGSLSSYGRFSGKAGIPAWQLAASKTKEAAERSGTAAETGEGGVAS
ncbi:MAG: peroxisomal membrane protein pex14 [Chrysothrix sp. TS-e1954]|nr:MAG: peroxisomal membrane protein pex14 [Chrysothrix sp. TS-e1954]